MRCEARFRATQVRASRAKGTSCGPRTGTRLATDGGPGTVTLTACHFPGGKPGPAVYEAIDHDLFKSGDAAAARAQVAKYGIIKPFVVFVSSLWAYKNQDGLLRAWARARPQLRGRQLVFVGAGPDSYAAELRSLAAELGIGDDLIFTGGLARRDGRLLPGRRPARLPVAQRDLRPAHPGGDGLRLSGSDLAGQLDAGNRGGAAILCDSADPASIAEALVAGVAPDRDRLRDMGLAGRPSSPGRPRPPRRSTSTARWPSADGGDEHRFLVNRPSRAPPELHAGVRLPWQAA